MIIGDGIMLGAGGESASIFVTGLSETDTVTATKGSKTLTGEWITRKNTEIKSLIPKMTSNTTPEGIASSYSVDSGSAAYYAFDAYGDDVGSDYYTSYPYSAGNDYIQYEFASSVKISKVRMNIFNDRAFTYTILISENGQDWINVCVFSQDSSLTSGITWMEKDLETVVTAKFIRCRIDHWTDKTGNPAVIREMRVYGPVETEVSGFLISHIKDYGTWTVTATNGTDTVTLDVLVDSAVAYNVEISYRNIDENIVLLIDGNNIEDISTYQRAITNTGVTLSDAQTKFFDKSLYFNGSAILQFESYTLGTGDFTIDFWMYNTATSNAFRRWITGNNGSFVNGTFCIRETSSGVIQTQNATSSTSVPRNQWVHIAAVRSNGTLKIYLNGTEIASTTDSTNYSEALKYIGGYAGSIGNETFQGYMDEIRISNIARWTSNFTPPTRPY